MVSEALQANIRRFAGDERGATAIEYGLIAAFIFLAIVGVLATLGPTLRDKAFAPVATALGT